uniref:Uncharacterized protein n=1 Tax=Plectus sambesii TaxID=2011161 RepID=A0A914US82_9BILA
MLQTIKKYTVSLAELVLQVALVIFYFFRFLFKGRPELKDPAKLCIDNRPHCCLHPATTGGLSNSSETTANGSAGVKLSSHSDKMARDSTFKTTTTMTPTTKTTLSSRKNAYVESVKSYLRSGYQRIGAVTQSACQSAKGGCATLKSKVGNTLSWIASFFKRSASKTKENASPTSAVPWRRVSHSDSAPFAAPFTSFNSSAQSSSIPAPPPPPPSSVPSEQHWSNKQNFAKMTWVNNADDQAKPAESPKESSVMIAPSTPSTPANPSYAEKSRVPEREIQFPVYANHQPQQQRSAPTVRSASSGRFKSPEPYRRTESTGAGSRRSSGSYLEHSAPSTGADSQALLMGRSVYTPVLEAEQMRPIINRRSSATPAPSDLHASDHTSHTSRSYARSRTVEPRPYEKASAVAEHQKYLANAQFEVSRARDDSVAPVRAISRQWPPPSNATGPEIIKDLWMANVVPQMESMELDSMTDPRAMVQSWHAETRTSGGGEAPVISNHFVSSSKGTYRESLYDQVRTCQSIARSLTSPPPSVSSRGRRIFDRRKDRVARFRRAQGHSPDPTDAASESDWITSGETDDEGALIHRAVRNPQGDVRDYHKLSKEYEVVMSNPERSVQLSTMLRGETGKGVDILSKRREKTDKYTVEHQRAAHRDIDPRDLVESVTDAAMRKSIGPNELSRFPNIAFDRAATDILAKRREEADRYAVEPSRAPLRDINPRELVESVTDAAMRKNVESHDWNRHSNFASERQSTVTPTAFANGPYDCRSPTPFRPLSVGMHDGMLPNDYNRIFSPQPTDRPFTPSSENYNSMPRDWRSFRQQYQ